MSFWNTIGNIVGIAGTVAGILDPGPDTRPNQRVASYNWYQQRVNAAEQVRQLGWQAWLAGENATLTREGADLTAERAGVQGQAADWQDKRARTLHAKADLMAGVHVRELHRRYGATNAAWQRTAAFVKADTKAAKANAQAARKAADAAIVRADVAVQRAQINQKMEAGNLKLGEAQSGVRASSYHRQMAAHSEDMLALTEREQDAAKSAASARAAAATTAAETAEARGKAALAFALGEHKRGIDSAADWYYQAEAGRQDLREQAMQHGLQAAATRTQAAGTALDARGQRLTGRAQEIQGDFFQTQAQIGRHFLAQQPGVTEYGGTEELVPKPSAGITPRDAPQPQPGAA